MSIRADSLAAHGAEGWNGGDVRLGEIQLRGREGMLMGHIYRQLTEAECAEEIRAIALPLWLAIKDAQA